MSPPPRHRALGREAHQRWSGWPGAYCLDCGADDPQELAIAWDWLDPYANTWDSDEHKQLVIAANLCPTTAAEAKALYTASPFADREPSDGARGGTA